MTLGKIMLMISAVALVAGTVGLVKDIRLKHRQRRQEKHYAAMREASADNEYCIHCVRNGKEESICL